MKKILYSGTFDPLTRGHLDMIERGSKIADELIVGIIRNPNKVPVFSLDDRMKMIEMVTAHLPNVKIDIFEGLLADYAKQNNIDAILRGLRCTVDFEYEIQMAQINCKLKKDLETVFLMTDEKYSFISSSMVREIYSLGGDIEDLVPEQVDEYLKALKCKEEVR